MYTRSGRKRSRNDKRSSRAKRFCSGEELLYTGLDITPFCELTVPPAQRVHRGERETKKVAALPLAASTVSTARMEVSVYMSRFWYWLDGRRFRNISQEGARPHILFQNSCGDTAAETWVGQLQRGTDAPGCGFLQLFFPSPVEMLFLSCSKELNYSRVLVNVMRSVAKKWYFHYGVGPSYPYPLGP